MANLIRLPVGGGNGFEVGDFTTRDKSENDNFILCNGGSVDIDSSKFIHLYGSFGAQAELELDQTLTSMNVVQIVCTETKQLARCADGDIYYSTNGTSWTQCSDITSCVSCVETNGTIYVAVTTDGRIYHSEDAESWTQARDYETSFKDVKYNSGEWLAVGDGGMIYGCESSMNWAPIDYQEGYCMNKIECGIVENMRNWVVVGSDMYLAFSAGTHFAWYQMEAYGTGDLLDLCYNGNTWYLIKSDMCFKSADGEDWRFLPGFYGEDRDVRALACSGNIVAIILDGGFILSVSDKDFVEVSLQDDISEDGVSAIFVANDQWYLRDSDDNVYKMNIKTTLPEIVGVDEDIYMRYK